MSYTNTNSLFNETKNLSSHSMINASPFLSTQFLGFGDTIYVPTKNLIASENKIAAPVNYNLNSNITVTSPAAGCHLGGSSISSYFSGPFSGSFPVHTPTFASSGQSFNFSAAECKHDSPGLTEESLTQHIHGFSHPLLFHQPPPLLQNARTNSENLNQERVHEHIIAARSGFVLPNGGTSNWNFSSPVFIPKSEQKNNVTGNIEYGYQQKRRSPSPFDGLDDLVHVPDPAGVVDYLYKSCSGKPYGGPKVKKVVEKKELTFKNVLRKPVKRPTKMKKSIPKQIIENAKPRTLLRTQQRPKPKSPEFVRSSSASSTSTSSSVKSNMSMNVVIPSQELIPAGGLRLPINKNPICKKFLRKECFDRKCYYLHATPITAQREQIIFLGGLPANTSRESLYFELLKNKIPVINFPMVIDKFTPRVVLDCPESALKYIYQKSISLFGKKIDVRPYKQSNEVFQVFLGGLPSGTTVNHIRQGLAKHGCTLVNVPSINKGYSINVEVKSEAEQKKLFAIGIIRISGKRVEVKQINKRKRKDQRKTSRH